MKTERLFFITFIKADENGGCYIAVQANDIQDVEKYAEENYSKRYAAVYPEHIFLEIEANYSDGLLNEISLVENLDEKKTFKS